MKRIGLILLCIASATIVQAQQKCACALIGNSDTTQAVRVGVEKVLQHENTFFLVISYENVITATGNLTIKVTDANNKTIDSSFLLLTKNEKNDIVLKVNRNDVGDKVIFLTIHVVFGGLNQQGFVGRYQYELSSHNLSLLSFR